jgi:hypothetical protein
MGAAGPGSPHAQRLFVEGPACTRSLGPSIVKTANPRRCITEGCVSKSLNRLLLIWNRVQRRAFCLGYSQALLRRPIGAIRRPGGHTFLMWPTSDCLDSQGPLDCAMFLLKAPLGYQGSRSWATIKKVWWPSGCLIAPIAYRPPLRRAWLQPRQKARLQNRFQSNNNRFKLLLQQPSLLQLRLTMLTKQGC